MISSNTSVNKKGFTLGVFSQSVHSSTTILLRELHPSSIIETLLKICDSLRDFSTMGGQIIGEGGGERFSKNLPLVIADQVS